MKAEICDDEKELAGKIKKFCKTALKEQKIKDEELKETLMEVIREIEKEKGYLIVDSIEGKVKLNLKDILYIKSNENYLEIYTEKYQYLKRQKITDTETELEKKGFYRVHKSYIINLEHLKAVNQKEVRMSGNRVVPISRGTCKKIKMAYMSVVEDKI